MDDYVKIGSVKYPRSTWNEMQRDAAPDKKEQEEMRRRGWISDFDNIGYPFSEQGWTRSYTTQTHIGRQNEDNRTLCGRDSTSWGGANPEPDNPIRDKCYASCKSCIKIYYNLLREARERGGEMFER